MKKILVVVDMQNDFLSGPLGTGHTRAAIPYVTDLVRNGVWDMVYLTLDTHNEEYPETLEGQKLPVAHCILNSPGSKICPEVRDAIHGMEQEIPDTFQYGTIAKWTFGSIDLTEKVYRFVDSVRGKDAEIHICGVCTSICVLANAVLLRARMPDAKIVVHAKACGDVDAETHEHALACLRMQQCDIED